MLKVLVVMVELMEVEFATLLRVMVVFEIVEFNTVEFSMVDKFTAPERIVLLMTLEVSIDDLLMVVAVMLEYAALELSRIVPFVVIM